MCLICTRQNLCAQESCECVSEQNRKLTWDTMRYFCNFLGQFLNFSLMDDNHVLQCLNSASLILATLTPTEPMEGVGSPAHPLSFWYRSLAFSKPSANVLRKLSHSSRQEGRMEGSSDFLFWFAKLMVVPLSWSSPSLQCELDWDPKEQPAQCQYLTDRHLDSQYLFSG